MICWNRWFCSGVRRLDRRRFLLLLRFARLRVRDRFLLGTFRLRCRFLLLRFYDRGITSNALRIWMEGACRYVIRGIEPYQVQESRTASAWPSWVDRENRDQMRRSGDRWVGVVSRIIAERSGEREREVNDSYRFGNGRGWLVVRWWFVSAKFDTRDRLYQRKSTYMTTGWCSSSSESSCSRNPLTIGLIVISFSLEQSKNRDRIAPGKHSTDSSVVVESFGFDDLNVGAMEIDWDWEWVSSTRKVS